MKNQITYLIVGTAVIVGGIFIFTYNSGPASPKISEDGSISGVYSIESILSLGQPYVCNFERSDEVSKVFGLMRTDGSKIFGEFRIETELMEVPFSSFLVVKDEKTYTWTTLAPIGYEAPLNRGATNGNGPVGTKDEIYYECKVWEEVDSTYFDLPEGVVFGEMKN